MINYDELCGIAQGFLSITRDEFWDMDPKEFYYAMRGKSKYEEQRMKAIQIAIYDSMRQQTFLILNHLLDKKDRYKDPKDLLKLRDELTPEEIKKLEAKQKGEPYKQSIDQMKQMFYAIAAGNKQRKRKLHNNPPKTKRK